MKRRVGFGAFVAAGFVLAVTLVLVVSPHASSQPDGLDKVAMDTGIGRSQRADPLDRTPTAGYAVPGVHDSGLSTRLAGLIGLVATATLVGGLLMVARRGAGRSTTTATE
jgi:hypothetical protein